MWDAVSACLAFLNSNSRSMPAGSDPALSRSRAASAPGGPRNSALVLHDSISWRFSTMSLDQIKRLLANHVCSLADIGKRHSQPCEKAGALA
jgi:hypothetical protein